MTVPSAEEVGEALQLALRVVEGAAIGRWIRARGALYCRTRLIGA